MANSNLKKQVHVSPGIYFSESELSVANTSLGITNLGLAGETLKGPAFQPIDITSWSEFQSFFGSTSTEKYIGSQYPKYELPYIAKTYLEQSRNLKVCRTLGLSGTNAGKAWLITAYKENPTGEEELGYTESNPVVIAVLRSRGDYKKAVFEQAKDETLGICEDVYAYDKLVYRATDVTIGPSQLMSLQDGCTTGWNHETGNLTVTVNNYGQFTLTVTLTEKDSNDNNLTVNYDVSLNPNDKNYIYNVLGGKQEDCDAAIYVEELYDIALEQLILAKEIDTLTGGESGVLNSYENYRIVPKYQEVADVLTNSESTLKRKDVGLRFIYSRSLSRDVEGNKIKVHQYNDGITPGEEVEGNEGQIYTVAAFTDTANGSVRKYYYKPSKAGNELEKLKDFETTVQGLSDVNNVFVEAVFVRNDNMYYVLKGQDITPITLDLNNYKEQYRYSSTPWIVSDLKGSAENIELNKLFRFHTISDGDNSVKEVKVSIENIEPSYGQFDVIIRDFYDTDASPVILEKYRQCDLVPGSNNYIAYKIGSFDETYETKSKYVTVEVNENAITEISSPAGFLGYPVRDYNGTSISENKRDGVDTIQKPYIQYNTNVDEDIRIRKQYFGMSDLMGIDEDVLKYKGVEAYNDLPEGLTPCFHLDSRIFNGTPDEDGKITVDGITQTVSVDGIKGYQWVTVGRNNTLDDYGIEPRIGHEEVMVNTIYEDKRYRKFTVCFYGGFDGWDYYRESRTNSDDFKYQKYRGWTKKNNISGQNETFSLITNPEAYGFDKTEKILNTDYYAYLSAIRKFANPKETDINVLATPGIDYVNNKELVSDVIEMVEDERADTIYVITTPDKPYGAGDTPAEMFTASEAVDNLDDSEIDTNWACTYYPWVKYFDSINNQYIYLPQTKDVVKNFAYTDNIAAPWFAAAGWNRGLTDGIRPKKNLILSEQDELYDGRINFVNSFANEGMRIWGDKNLQVLQDSQLSRISKRRCLIRLRKLISIACIGLIFDPNDNTTVSSFKSAVEPILENFVSNRALVDAKLVVDDSQESRDRLEINAQIYIKFVPNLEYIKIGLVASPSGVDFDDI